MGRPGIRDINIIGLVMEGTNAEQGTFEEDNWRSKETCTSSSTLYKQWNKRKCGVSHYNKWV